MAGSATLTIKLCFGKKLLKLVIFNLHLHNFCIDVDWIFNKFVLFSDKVQHLSMLDSFFTLWALSSGPFLLQYSLMLEQDNK